MAVRIPIVAAMEIWSVLVLVPALVLGFVAWSWRRRASVAEATLHSIRLIVGVDAANQETTQQLRMKLAAASEAESAAAKYLGALDGASLGIAIVDCVGAVMYANPAGAEMLEGEGERAVLATRVSALAKRVCVHGTVEQIESQVHDPIRRVLVTTAVPVNLEDSEVGAVALYIEDFSDQERVDAMRTDFVANASHELKTPLGALSILAETLAESDDEATRFRLASRLREESLRMVSVIDDVVQLAETESLGIEFELVSVPEVVAEAADAVRSLAEEQQIRLIRGDIVTGSISGSHRQVASAIRNLLENAVTYTALKGEGGTVAYSARRDDGSICIDVQDTGVGVPDRYADRVFERFFRVDRARSRESGGTGLGLSIVKNVALAHGGSVSMQSEVGIGSTFTMCLPEVAEDIE